VTIASEYVAARTAWSAIVHEAEQRAVDLVIVGMPYRKRMGRVVVGRTVQNVFVNAPCQVIAVRERAAEVRA
jgi:nucleotide-binding universal stress UspA family protein